MGVFTNTRNEATQFSCGIQSAVYIRQRKQLSHVNKRVWMKKVPHFLINTAATFYRILQKRLWSQQQLHLLGSSLRIVWFCNSTCRLYVWICSDILSERSHMLNNHNTDLCDPTTLTRVHSHTCTPKKKKRKKKVAQRSISHSYVTQILPTVTPAEMGELFDC